MQASRRNKIVLFLLLLMMVLAGLLGLYLASRGLHPRQIRQHLLSSRPKLQRCPPDVRVNHTTRMMAGRRKVLAVTGEIKECLGGTNADN